MRILITGAAGYLGQALIDRLAADNELCLTDIRPREDDGRDWQRLDVTDLDAARDCVRGHDAVVHTVALVRDREDEPLASYAKTMVLGTWTVAEACALEGVGQLVNISSVVADGFDADPTIAAPDWFDVDSSRQRRVSDPPVFTRDDRFYEIAKHLGEAIVRAYGSIFPIAAVNLRPGVIAGDGENPEPVRPAGAGPYWFMHVDRADLADGVARALEAGATGTYNLVAGRRDAHWEWESAAKDFGYAPKHCWPEIDQAEVP
jgi:nucleoside-diphosphate-sugar epimerase